MPVDPRSPTYKITMLYFSNITPESWIQFQKFLERVLSGQGDTTGPNKYTRLRQLLQGESLVALETHMISVPEHTKTNDFYFLAANVVSKKLFPRNATKMQKRFLRCYLCKPETMSTRHYAARVSEINNFFMYFPI